MTFIENYKEQVQTRRVICERVLLELVV